MKKILLLLCILFTLNISSANAFIITIDGSISSNNFKDILSRLGPDTSGTITKNRFSINYRLDNQGGEGSIIFFSPNNVNCSCTFEFQTEIVTNTPQLVEPSEDVVQQQTQQRLLPQSTFQRFPLQQTFTTIKGSSTSCLAGNRFAQSVLSDTKEVKQINCRAQTLKLNSKNNDKAILTVEVVE